MNLNKVFILGNVTRDPEIRSMPNGGQVASLGMATNRVWKDAQGQKREDAEFHNIVAFGKLADTISRYVFKGSMILIEGRLKTSSWDDKSTGAKRYKTEIIAETMQLGPRGAGSSESGPASSSGYGRPSHNSEQSETKQEEIPVIEENYTPSTVSLDNNTTDEINVKDIPF